MKGQNARVLFDVLPALTAFHEVGAESANKGGTAD